MEKLLKKFGLNDKEIKVFLQLLEIGSQPVSSVAKFVNLPRTSLYFTLESLEQKHLVESFNRFGIRYVKTIPSTQLREVLLRRQIELEKTMVELEGQLPQFETIESKHSLKPQIKIHDGREAVIRMYENILQSETTFCAYVNFSLVEKYMKQIGDQIPITIKRKKMQVREVGVDCPESYEYQREFQSEHHQIKILPPNYLFPSDTIICPTRACVILYDRYPLVSALEIYNEGYVKTQQMAFEALWSTA